MKLKEFFRYYSYSIVRILVDQIAIALFAVAIAIALAGKSMPMTVASSIFSIFFFMFMVAELSFRQGASDKEKTDLGRFKKNDLTGFYMGLIANIPNLVITLGFNLFYFIPATRGSVSGVFGLIIKLICGEYLGLFSIDIGSMKLSSFPPVYFLAIIPCIFAAWLGYYLGVNGRIVVKPTKKDLE